MTVPLVHDFGRPSWRCQVCGDWWPCGAARAEILDAFAQSRPSDGTRFLSYRMQDAIHDACAQEGGKVEDLEEPGGDTVYHRFLLWYLNDMFRRRAEVRAERRRAAYDQAHR